MKVALANFLKKFKNILLLANKTIASDKIVNYSNRILYMYSSSNTYKE